MKILCFNDITATDGVTFYRAKQPLEYLKSKGHEIVYWRDYVNAKDRHDLMEEIATVDLIWCATPSDPKLLELLAELTRQSLKEQLMLAYGVPKEEMLKEGLSIKPLRIVCDLDDDLFQVNPHNIAYMARGRKEVLYTDPDTKEVLPLWKDGSFYTNSSGVKAMFSSKTNSTALASIIEILRLSDMITTPSQRLKRRLKRFAINGPAVLLPNAIDLEGFPYQVPTDYTELRLLWTLSASHYQDWVKIYPTIGRLMKKYTHLTLVTVGAKFPVANRAIPLSRWEHHGWQQIGEYGKYLSSLKCNLAVAHVCPDKFNLSKSALKWEEYATLGIPSLVSNHLYGDLIAGDEALVYSSVEDFEQKMELICSGNTKDLPAMAARAYETIKKSYALPVVGAALEKSLLELLQHE